MTKIKLLSWNTTAKEIKVNSGSQVHTLKATSSLFARMLVITRSARESIDLETVIGTHEFAYTNRILMKPDGSIHPTTDKNTVIHLLENLVKTDSNTTQESLHDRKLCCLVVDGMEVLQELMAVKNFKDCKDLATSYVKLIDSKGRGYEQVRVIFDNYTKVLSLKEGTRQQRRDKTKGIRSFEVDGSTRIRDKGTFLSSSDTKDSLTIYLAEQLINTSTTENLMTATHKRVMTNFECLVTTGVSTQEEADTLMILHAAEVAKSGLVVHIYSQDTDVLLLALRRLPALSDKAALIMGTSEHRRKVMLRPIYDELGQEKAAALINWHALTGCDTTGHIQGKSKKGCFSAFLAAHPSVISAIAGLGVGTEPSVEVVRSCEEFLTALFCPRHLHITRADALRWHLFKLLKPDQGVDKLPPTPGAWMQHIRRAHLQANIWSQDLVLHPNTLDPLKLGWQKEGDKLLPVLSEEPAAPDAVLQLVRCNCGATRVHLNRKVCTRVCSCKTNNIVCTELCNCEGDVDKCQNIQKPTSEEDSEEE